MPYIGVSWTWFQNDSVCLVGLAKVSEHVFSGGSIFFLV